jgi:hypothetical protein
VDERGRQHTQDARARDDDGSGDRAETQGQRGINVRQGNCTPCAGGNEAARHADESASSADVTNWKVSLVGCCLKQDSPIGISMSAVGEMGQHRSVSAPSFPLVEHERHISSINYPLRPSRFSQTLAAAQSRSPSGRAARHSRHWPHRRHRRPLRSL